MAAELQILAVTAPEQLDEIRDLAREIWCEHYPGIITVEQIEYMLERMYAPEAMRRNWQQSGTTYDRALLDRELVGYSAYRPATGASETKLYSLYVRADVRGHGVGRRLVNRVVDRARRAGSSHVVLTVNKNNDIALRAYNRFGFQVRQSVVTDIGGGFVMDDYLMELAVNEGS